MTPTHYVIDAATWEVIAPRLAEDYLPMPVQRGLMRVRGVEAVRYGAGCCYYDEAALSDHREEMAFLEEEARMETATTEDASCSQT